LVVAFREVDTQKVADASREDGSRCPRVDQSLHAGVEFAVGNLEIDRRAQDPLPRRETLLLPPREGVTRGLVLARADDEGIARGSHILDNGAVAFAVIHAMEPNGELMRRRLGGDDLVIENGHPHTHVGVER
jgi:hypothetical protein